MSTLKQVLVLNKNNNECYFTLGFSAIFDLEFFWKRPMWLSNNREMTWKRFLF